MKLECVCGLSQHALLVDVAAKVLADNLAPLMYNAAALLAELPARSRRCNRAYAAALLQRQLPGVVLFTGDFVTTILYMLDLLGRMSQRFRHGRSRLRLARHFKPHRPLYARGEACVRRIATNPTLSSTGTPNGAQCRWRFRCTKSIPVAQCASTPHAR